ncbi:hypothetical protein O7627_12855 [Solwaraspora sp. WMMD1047]|uniref:hypothetical protein n=1 Tax=Solwaraspora sp. WMMD1047 TaxID=3016102 RepID=UPI0024174D1E|nr:hypothetical protein [Solwaraspora sp. WMMD1047]MDG4830187.1 hypothetical protein [Solwaraspora sp. WMMD1047]
MTAPTAAHLVVNSRMLHFCWLPADAEAVAAMLPDGVKPLPDQPVSMNQYVVDDLAQTSGTGAYSVTYFGIDLDGSPGGAVTGPIRWWDHYLTSSPQIRSYARSRGVPARPGVTTIDVDRGRVVAVTEVDGVPLIRTVARAGHCGDRVWRGEINYLSRFESRWVVGQYPYVMEPVDDFEVESVEFLRPDHPVYALRPANPLELYWGSYSPRSSFACPGGETAPR